MLPASSIANDDGKTDQIGLALMPKALRRAVTGPSEGANLTFLPHADLLNDVSIGVFERRASSTRRAVPAYELSATRRPALRSKAASASVGPLVTS